MRYLEIDKIDMLMVSHSDNDHRGGAPGILEAMEVDEIVAPAGVRFDGRVVTRCQLGQNWRWGIAEFQVIHPRDPEGWSDNNASCVLQIVVDGHSVLLPGDIEAVAELVVLGRSSLVPAQLVIAPHHGSMTSSTTKFIQFLRPAHVVFTVGYLNRWGFPSPAVVQRWQTHGACLFDTSRTGALIFEYDSHRGFVLSQAAATAWQRPWPVRSNAAAECLNPL
jgi:competence protein ComEC